MQLPRGRAESGPPNPERGPAAEPLPKRCAPRQGREGEAQGCSPPALPAHPGTMGAGSPPPAAPGAERTAAAEKFGVRGLGAAGGPSPAFSSCLRTSPPEAAPGDGGVGGEPPLPPLPPAASRHPRGRRGGGGESAAAALGGAGSRSEPPAMRGGRAGGAAPSPFGAPAGCLLLLRGSAAE